MYRTVFAVLAASLAIGCAAAVSAPAHAVSDQVTCDAVLQASIEMGDSLAAGSEMADIKQALAEVAAKLAAAAAEADPGPLKTALEEDVVQLNRAASAPDDQVVAILDEHAVAEARDRVDALCGF
ncbi:hypothetical protein NDR87_36770 [Nocardia sp. CDC159]|uniref:Secreted protein n=1 Tax=Nocardia pulmonis TaxID=2951408 RepID=A0A9X2EJ07_9NOCA|nr:MULTISPECIES: hypothetical protein [Nocardia]MCM6779041.1 hypothetical protein [Nocardia pulmonis]MCM6791931.1 hypothetical protein [Nocardia sp. CDC159]